MRRSARRRLATPATLFSGTDVHRERGFACVDCHGGDPAAGDKARAHDAARGFKGAPVGQAQIATCARCHSDADPDAPLRAASSAWIRRPSTPRACTASSSPRATATWRPAPAATARTGSGWSATRSRRSSPPTSPRPARAATPIRVTWPSTSCADGTALPTSQFADYQKSVHYAALTKGNDLSAPTCNDCHGNHGAAPPGVGAVANVCGTLPRGLRDEVPDERPRADLRQGVRGMSQQPRRARSRRRRCWDRAVTAICATCHSGADDKGAVAADGCARHRRAEARDRAIAAR